MKKVKFLILFLAVLASSCGNYGNGELTGVPDRERWFTTDPYGMKFIKMGTYTMGDNDQDVPWAMTSPARTVSIAPFWMDETEITNNEYRQFVFWVRDSLARLMLGVEFEEDFLFTEDENGEIIDPPFINWETPIDWKDPEYAEILKDLYLSENERFYRRKEIDTRKLNYTYWWIDLKQAAKKFNFEGDIRHHYDEESKRYTGQIRNEKGEMVDVIDRSSFIMKDEINVYPDTLCWIADFTYSFNEPMTNSYFWHPAYDHYPVVGVNWKQAFAFCRWRTQLQNGYIAAEGNSSYIQDYRLPLESEWEYAARGGQDLSMYPWGGYYTRNYQGCFLANFKPMRGNYVDDGGIYTVPVASFEPNDFGLYDMAGNVAEWTSNAFDESAHSFVHDLNPDYQYDAHPDDAWTLKRKAIRGGSWKDIGYYLQNGTRNYEYQDTAKSYIGFRCVRSFLGRDINDTGGNQVY